MGAFGVSCCYFSTRDSLCGLHNFLNYHGAEQSSQDREHISHSGPLHIYMRAHVTKDQNAETTARYHRCNFTSDLMTQLCAWFGLEKAATTPYHVQFNGQVERAHQTLVQMIWKLEPKQK